MEHCVHLRASQQAWTIYLTRNNLVSPADSRRCSLERFVQARWAAGETDLDGLTCSGLSFLSRLTPLDMW
jgi:hypothetical protein